jgi:hypothetical protein
VSDYSSDPLDSPRTGLRAEFDGTKAELRAEFQGLRADLHAMKTELIKWMFVLCIAWWIATVVPIAGLILQTR